MKLPIGTASGLPIAAATGAMTDGGDAELHPVNFWNTQAAASSVTGYLPKDPGEVTNQPGTAAFFWPESGPSAISSLGRVQVNSVEGTTYTGQLCFFANNDNWVSGRFQAALPEQ